MKWLRLCLFAVVSMCPSALRAEFRNWTNTEGKIVDAELVKVDGDSVTFRLRNGNMTTYFLSDAEGAKLGQGGYHGGINPDAFAAWVKGAAAKTK